ncbi:MAG: aminomethyl-transferring glycine dehydrogenase subunit GcvPB [candidate division Zixibacteria bacterium]|nr:aminomethyl-transferring glycine dehydrogenase subunit GcvPB [candidate division Zixibacteria bacterium]
MNDLGGQTIFDLSSAGTEGVTVPQPQVPSPGASWRLPESNFRSSLPDWPEVSEIEVVRHYTRLSILNHHIDRNTYPLGSCTMKYNPKINERAATKAGFARLHPETPDADCQGALQLMWDLARDLAAITGMDEICLQGSAGAQGEMAGLLMARAYHRRHGEHRLRVIIPDSAHGTNPASVTLAGFESVAIRSDARGLVDPDALAAVLDDSVACIMLTNPNTLGLFERDIVRIAGMAHAKGALLYNDGANTNALLGLARAGDMGFDMLHLNLHKTFSTPHGGGGPAAAAIGAKRALAPFLPGPAVVKRGETGHEQFAREAPGPDSIGSIHPFVGNFGVLVRAYTYIRSLGALGLAQVAQDAILAANYLRARLATEYDIPHPGPCLHEFVASASRQKQHGVRAGAIAKRLLDFGVHSPTVYFPLIVPEALMIEPTETESQERLDAYAEAFLQIAREARHDPDLVNSAPHETPFLRIDEAKAARELDVG